MSFRFSSRSRSNLATVDPRLREVAALALKLSEVDFIVTEGLRSPARQRQLLAAGKSTTRHSRHLTGRAIDVAALENGEVTWSIAPYRKIARAFKAAARTLGVTLKWGGDWKTLVDAVHFEITD